MPASQAADTISQEEYTTYTGDWLTLVNDHTKLPQAFQLPEVNCLNFLNFTLDQVAALTAPDVTLVKARFLAIADTDDPKVLRFSTALFGLDADGQRLTEYYVPLPPQAGGPTTDPAGSAAGPTPHITRKEAQEWLTAWDDAGPVAPTFFDTPGGTLRGYNFGVSTLKDPLAAAQPTAGKGLFLNLGLHHDPTSPNIAYTLDLVLYINLLGSRAQGTLAGTPTDESYYNGGHSCPPKPMMS